MISAQEGAYVVITKEMAVGLIHYLNKQNLLHLFDGKHTITCLRCGNHFIKNGGLCTCYEDIPHYHNYHCLISEMHMPDIDDVFRGIRNSVNMKKRASVRNELELEAEGYLDKDDLGVIFKLQAGLCYYCMSPIYDTGQNKYSIDHIIPLSSGGSNWLINIALTCNGCNLNKSWKSEMYYLRKIRGDKSDTWIEDHKEYISFIKRQKRKKFIS